MRLLFFRFFNDFAAANRFFIRATPWTIYILLGFLLGSVHFSYILPKLLMHRDICRLSDDHNPGAANVFIHCGVSMGLLCLVFDMAKGFIPVFLAARAMNINSMMFAAVMLAPVLGHALGVFNRFRGGKCIATAFGVLLGLIPYSWVVFLLAAVYITFSTLLKVRPNRRRSIAAFLVFGSVAFILLIIQNHLSFAFGCAAISITAIIRHLPAMANPAPSEAAEQTHI